jgi:hypothetical protein
MKNAGGGLILPILLTCALFFSGLLVFFTPLPLVYALLRTRGQAFFPFAISALFLVLILYLLGVQYLPPLYESYPDLAFLLPLPGAGLLGILPEQIVVILGIAYFGFYVVIGYAIYSAFVMPNRLYQILAITLSGCFLFGLVTGFVMVGGAWQETLAAFRSGLTQAADQFIAMQAKADLDTSQLLLLRQSRDLIVTYAVALSPAFFFTFLAMLLAVNLVAAKRLFVATFPELVSINLIKFQIPFGLVWLAIIIVATLLSNHWLWHVALLKYASLNLLLALTVFYFFQGFAVVIHFLDSRKIYGMGRLLAYMTLLLFLESAWLILAILGLAENWLDLRKLNIQIGPTPIVK